MIKNNHQFTNEQKFSYCSNLFGSLSDFLLSFLASLLIIPTLCFWFNFSITPIVAVASIVAGIAFNLWLNRNRLKYAVVALIILMFIIIGSYYIANLFIDTSWDGWMYHQPAVMALLEGWNPVREPSLQAWWGEAKTINGNNISFSNLGEGSLWITHYAKASWIMSACVAKLTGNLQAAKFINLLAIIACFFNAYKFFNSFKVSFTIAMLFSLLYSANFIALSQMTTTYNDGFLGSLFGLLLTTSLLWLKNNKPQEIINILFASTILLNIKFSGLSYTLILFTMIFVGVLIFRRAAIYKITFILVSYATVGIIIGFNPYITNFYQYGHPFYPINKINIVQPQINNHFLNENRITKLLSSIYAEIDSNNDSMPKIKFPLIIHEKERQIIKYSCDIRYAGFGFFFSVVFTLLCLLTVFFTKTFCKQPHTKLLILGITTIITSTALFPESWWARYVPQLWYAPVLLAFTVYISGRLVISLLLSCFILLSTAYSSGLRIKEQYLQTKNIYKDYKIILKSKNIKIYPFREYFASPFVYYAGQHGVHTEIAKDINNCKPIADCHFKICS